MAKIKFDGKTFPDADSLYLYAWNNGRKAEKANKTFYAVDTWDDMDDYGVHYVERKLYRTLEAAQKRAEEYKGVRDELMHYAHVMSFEVVDE